MIFLIQYNRRKGEVILLNEFLDSEKEIADNARLRLELELKERRVNDEVVVLQADSETALRHTHGRYFKDLTALGILSSAFGKFRTSPRDNRPRSPKPKSSRSSASPRAKP